MEDKAFDIMTKSLLGDDITDEEKIYLQKRNAKYKLVQYLVKEKMEHLGKSLSAFQFTPGKNFDDLPVIDIVEEIIRFSTNKKIWKPMDFDDLDGVSNPPCTGMKKKSIVDI